MSGKCREITRDEGEVKRERRGNGTRKGKNERRAPRGHSWEMQCRR